MLFAVFIIGLMRYFAISVHYVYVVLVSVVMEKELPIEME